MLDALGNTVPVDPPRSLTAKELDRIARIDRKLAMSMLEGTCPSCELNRTGVMHTDACRIPVAPQVGEVGTEVRQPWDPRPSRRAA